MHLMSVHTYVYVCILVGLCVYLHACVQWHTLHESPTNLQVDSLKLPPFFLFSATLSSHKAKQDSTSLW